VIEGPYNTKYKNSMTAAKHNFTKERNIY